MKTISHSADGFVVFYPYKKQRTDRLAGTTPDVYMDVNEMVVKKPIISIQTSKSKGAPGTFSVTLVGDKNYKKLIPTGSWCCIYMANHQLTGRETNGPNEGLRMVGVVKSVRRRETNQRGIKSVVYTIAGIDHQNGFNTKVYINGTLIDKVGQDTAGQLFQLLAQAVQQTRNQKGEIKGGAHPDILVKTLIDLYLGRVASLTIHGPAGDQAQTFTDKTAAGRALLVPAPLVKRLWGQAGSRNLFTHMVAFLMQGNLLGINPIIPQIATGAPTVWSLLQQFGHLLLNEIYTELVPMKVDNEVRLVPAFIHRAQPFNRLQLHPSCITFGSTRLRNETPPLSSSNSNQTKLASYYISKEIEEHEILDADFGKSESERKNFVFVTPRIEALQRLSDDFANLAVAEAIDKALRSKGLSAANELGLSDPVSMSRYGLEPIVTSTQFLEKIEDIPAINQIIRDMYGLNYLWENGFLMLVGPDEHIPVGTNLVFKARGWVGHVERVTYNYTVTPNGTHAFRASIALVHMQKTDGTPIDETEGDDSEGSQIGAWDRGASWNGDGA